MDWKYIEVGDYVSIKYKGVNHQIFSGEITQIRHYNRQTDTMIDPLTYYFSDDYYEFCLKIQRQYGFKEYALNSLFWNLTNIIKKGEISTMPLEIGKKYKVNIPQDWQDPGQSEFIGELIAIQDSQILTHLVYSKELDDKNYGHCGFKESGFGHWWCNPKWLTPVEESTKETIKLEDIFNE